ncbi:MULTISPECIES: FkbM family methyltransferase [Paenarthrobacter]|uniref:FkbM family methyltransferase n=1 Tax=Paenarthrobacter ureafaciens TaxID=37931 RepID=A0AAX3EFA0_PAEUR|nr:MULTISPECIES: FkbM family methyltransferase [Paenarthrobacter]OEH60394.1 hypothetical protein A5N13_05335 [Arthrobacter sp. D4]OEH61009.1 hypothetical protein A5N17_16370 [Arthrobacter sp. D2]MDO5865860.1 FkbM family methyltransferase [Paenarthrobacter sp. SD-2]MDO5876954.1 FkbM family methyltransferase [Paenarthrobacter sp. SD-1]QMU83586.1 FkbM family methyltransferase [Paenarthrobacter ureafaciens]
MSPTEIVVDGSVYRLSLPDAETDYIQKTIASSQRPYEEAMLIDMGEGLKPGDLVLDVGANCGNHTLYLSCVVGAEVHAFEPDPELCDVIRTNVALNEVDDLVEVHQVGVGDVEGFGRIVQTAENNRGAQRLERTNSREGGAKIIRLDTMDFGKPVRVLKVDVEGMEINVLNGARDLIERDRPEIYVECQGRQDFEMIHTWMTQLEYRYVSTFNATPTHRFSFATSSVERGRFEQIVKQQISASYYDHKLILQLRKSLSEASMKYREVSAQLSPLNEQIRLSKKVEDYRANLIKKLESDLLSSNEREQRLESVVSELQLQISASLAQQTELSTEKSELHGRAETLAAELQDLRENLRLERGRAVAAEKQVLELTGRVSRLDAQASLQSGLHDEERRSWQQEVESTEADLAKLRRHATLSLARARLSLRREKALASELTQVSSRLAEGETSLAEARHQVGAVQARLVKETGMVSRLQRALEGSNREKQVLQDALAAGKKENSTLSVQLQAQKRQLCEAEKSHLAEIERLQVALELAEHKLRDLRASVTYRLGRSLRDALKSPRNLGTLPLHLGRLAREHRGRQQEDDVAVGEIAAREDAPNLDVDGSAPFVNGAAELRTKRWLPDGDSSAALQLSASASRTGVRIAAIMDEFTVQSFAPECELLELSVDNYLSELETFSPALVFLESAWRGKGDAWGNKVAQTAAEIREIVAWASARNIPVVLWNKEDPVHYSTFLNTAKLADVVFTTDIDCVQRYKADLGHGRVHFLPFACQPVLHNPIETFQRSEGICFAGAYYRRYPERTRDLESFMSEIPSFVPLDIFDRNFGKSDEQYQFPAEYRSHIVGTLKSSEIDLAYKGYDYAINLNSVKESQSMFARRVYELLASNTTVVSNYSRGVQLLFGDITHVSDSGHQIVKALSSEDAWTARRRKLAGLRKVMREHTYSHRLNYILDKVGLEHVSIVRPKITVFALVSSHDQVARVKVGVDCQTDVDVILRLYTEDAGWLKGEHTADGVKIEHISSISDQPLSNLISTGNFAAIMHPDDYYGPNYLLDLSLAGRYSNAAVVGKSSHFRAKGRILRLKTGASAYTAVGSLPAHSSLVLKPSELSSPLDRLLRMRRRAYFDHKSMMEAEVFDYCRGGYRLAPAALPEVSSGEIDEGLRLEEIVAAGDSIEVSNGGGETERVITGAELAGMFITRSRPGLKTMVEGDVWAFESTMADGVHDYIYAAELLDLSSLIVDDELKFHVETEPGLNLQVAMIYYDESGTKISGHVRPSNQNHVMSIPNNAASLKVGIRVSGAGACSFRRIIWAHKDVDPVFIACRADNLVITNRYPAYGDLYKNAFVHSRALRYAESGVPTEVFVLDENSPLRFREFEGMTVITGSCAALESVLADGRHQSISVHFLNEEMWKAVSNLAHRPHVAIWAHGADIQKWSRRRFLYSTQEQIEKAKISSEQRLALWRRVISEAQENVTLVFVSRWLMDTALEDLALESGPPRSAVIPNPVDTSKFSYHNKPVELRMRFLSIRPYASSVYANDLTVEAILLLSATEEFSRMEFRLVGDGPLFDDLTQPLQQFSNVILDKRFLNQDEISAMHKQYGVFLCPSRMDTHGVSRDEAMASGLVPITTRVAAIPEFVDDNCAELVEPENAQAIADAILRLARSKRLFSAKSREAAKRVRRQSSATNVIPQELKVLGR